MLKKLLFFPLLLAGCSGGVVGPADTLVGRWANDFNGLDATLQRVVFTTTCWQATFAPIAVDAEGRFQAVSTQLISNKPVIMSGRIEISGSVAGNEVVMVPTFVDAKNQPHFPDPGDGSVRLPRSTKTVRMTCK